MSRIPLHAFAALAALGLVVAPALACERHKEHTASVSSAATPAPPPVSAPAPVLASPAAAALSISEALGTEPYDMRCPRLRKVEQALTQ